jgi:hypothetical protein
MKPSSLWIILIRIISIYLILSSIFQMPQTFMYTSSMYGNYNSNPIVYLFFIFWIGCIYLLYLFGIQFPHKIIKLLKLNTQFEEDRFQLDLNQKSVVKAAIIIIAGLLFMNNFVLMIQEIILFSQQEVYDIKNYPQSMNIATSIIKNIFAYFLIFNSTKIADYILKNEEE